MNFFIAPFAILSSAHTVVQEDPTIETCLE
jgi:hypothetical protein